MQKTLTLTIDGKSLQAREGQTILEVARENGIKIPTLCYMKHLTPWGGCRLCVVEIQGSSKVVPACTTPATEGSVIIANSDRLRYLRRATLELLLSERNHRYTVGDDVRLYANKVGPFSNPRRVRVCGWRRAPCRSSTADVQISSSAATFSDQ